MQTYKVCSKVWVMSLKTQGHTVYKVSGACQLLYLLQVVKKIWAHIKEHDLQNPKDRRKIIPDEVLGSFLTAPVNMMSMNSQLSKHCFTKGEVDDIHLNCTCEILMCLQGLHYQTDYNGSARCSPPGCI